MPLHKSVMIKLIVVLFLSVVSVNITIAATSEFELSALPNGGDYYCVPQGSDIDWPWHLKIGQDNYKPQHVLLASENHFCRLWMQRYWLSHTENFKHSYILSDFRLGESSDDYHVLQIDYNGYGLEGYAIVTLYRRDNKGSIHIESSNGFYSKNTLHNFEASLGLAKTHISDVSIWARNGAKQTLTMMHPLKEKISRYRKGLEFYYGKVPIKLTKLIIEGNYGYSHIAILNNDQYKSLLEEHNKIASDPPISIDNSDKRKKVNKLFLSYIDGLCKKLEPYCSFQDSNTHQNHDPIYPQHYLGLDFHFTAPSTKVVKSRYEVFNIDNNIYTYRLNKTAGRVLKTNGSSITLKFKPNHRLYLKGLNEPVAYFIGQFNEKGFSSGKGTLVLGSSQNINLDSSRYRKIIGTFDNGQLSGIAEWYHENGDINLIGEFQKSQLEGRVAFFLKGDRPKLAAQYSKNKLTDGPYIEYKLGWEDLTPWKVFEGRINKGQKSGEWKDIPRVIHYNDNATQIIEGDMSILAIPNEQRVIRGKWVAKSRYRSTGKFQGECEDQWPEGLLVGNCDKYGNIHGQAVFYRKSDGKRFQTSVDKNGRFSYEETVLIRIKKRDVFSRLGREFTRWGQDIKRNFKELICEIPEIFDSATGDNTKCNVAEISVSVDNNGNVFFNNQNIFNRAYTLRRKYDDIPSDAEIAAWNKQLQIQSLELDYWDFDLAQIAINRSIAGEYAQTLENTDVLSEKYSFWGPKDLKFPIFEPDHVVAPTRTGKLRRAYRGKPKFGEFRSRLGGLFHMGYDFETKKDDFILAPVTGEVIAVVKHEKHPLMNTVIIKTDSVKVKVLYVTSSVSRGDKVYQGEMIGTASDISSKYAGVPNHVHMGIFSLDEKKTYSMNGRWEIDYKKPFCPPGMAPKDPRLQAALCGK